MKKNLFVALAVTLLAAGCQKTDVLNQLPDAMTFSTEMGKITKAVGTADAAATNVMDNLYAQDFQVWAYTSFTNLNFPTVGAIYDGMEGIFVTRSESETWSTQKQHYWPGMKDATTGNDLKFFAISGQTIATTAGGATTTTTNGEVDIKHITTTNDITSSTLTIEDFTVNHENANTDLMVADFVKQNQTSNNNSKAVTLKFRHTLSKVQFLFKTLATGKDENQQVTVIEHPVYVQSITVADINTKATLTVTDNKPAETEKPTWYQPEPEKAQTQIQTYYKWGNLVEKKPFVADYADQAPGYIDLSKLKIGNESVTIERLDPTATTQDNTALELTTTPQIFDTWLVLPQTIKNDATGDDAIDLKVEVRYVIGTREFKSVFALSTETLDAWAPNQYIKYNVTLAPNLISFNPSVEEWNQYDSDPNTSEDQDVTMQN